MKLGTITVHNGYNYGASLQAYALVEALRELGVDANLVDYRNDFIEKKQVKNKDSFLKKAIKLLLLGTHGSAMKKKRFDEFNNSIISGKPYFSCDELEELNKKYDGFVCGSDQIWNMNITDFDPAFFAAFADSSKIKMAYAASLGEEKIDSDKKKEFFKENLKNLDFISLREQSGTEIISHYTDKECATVLDPVLLLDKEKWSKMAESSKVKTPKYKYAFYYELFRNDDMFRFALEKAKRENVTLIRMDILPLKAKMYGCVSLSAKGIGPVEFVKLISGAEFVVTNSFHGTVFSLMFEKDFYVMPFVGKFAKRTIRIENILNMLSLEDHFIRDKECSYNKVDFEKINKILQVERDKSRDFILNAIKGKE